MRSVAWAGRVAWVGLAVALAGCAAAQTAGGEGGGEAAPLEGTEWTLVELNGRPPVSIRDTPTLAFEEGSRASGNGGCNRFNGPYMQDGDALQLGPLASTRRACVDDAGNRQESSFLGALRTVRRFAVSGEELTLFAYGREVARLRRRAG
jgi:heat shock protein HslJ